MSAFAVAGELRAAVGRLARRMREQVNASGDISWSQATVLARLDRDGPATVTTLARGEGVRPQSMGATISGLEAAGLVAGSPDPDDGRQTILRLTDAGRRWLEASRAARQDWLARAIETRLADDDLADLARAIPLLRRLADG